MSVFLILILLFVVSMFFIRNKREAPVFNYSIGVETPNCPYCGVELKKFPGRKTKCKECGNFIFVRTRPADGKRILIKEDEKESVQIEWERKNGTYELRQAKRNEFAQMKRKLQSLRHCDFVPDRDVYWNIYQERHLKELTEGRWIDYRDTTDDMANLLYKEKKYKGALEYYLEALYIDICLPFYYEEKGKSYQLFSPKESIFEYKMFRPLTAFYNCIEELSLNTDAIKNIFMASIFPQIPFPITREEAWLIIEKNLKK